MTFQIKWIDGKREPKEKPNPVYPLGIDADVSAGAAKTCKATLPYPAPRCGLYHVLCNTCGYSCAITTAGRVDDPRSVKLPCYGHRAGPVTVSRRT